MSLIFFEILLITQLLLKGGGEGVPEKIIRQTNKGTKNVFQN